MGTAALLIISLCLLLGAGRLALAGCDAVVPGNPTGPAHARAVLSTACRQRSHRRCRCRHPPAAGVCGPLAAVATLYRRVKAWEDYAQPLAVLQLGQPASALHYVPGVREAGPPRFLAAGDAAGGLHLLSPSGQLVLQHHTGVCICCCLQQAKTAVLTQN